MDPNEEYASFGRDIPNPNPASHDMDASPSAVLATSAPSAYSVNADPPSRELSKRASGSPGTAGTTNATGKKTRRRADTNSQKRRCVSTACVACRKRKSKCDGAVPSCAACASVYGTECVYDPNSDHRRKGVYREKTDTMKAQSSTLQVLIEAILSASEDNVSDIVKKIRTCDNLDSVAEQILKQERDVSSRGDSDNDNESPPVELSEHGERELARKMGELRVEDGAVRFIGGTSHLIYLGDPHDTPGGDASLEQYAPGVDPTTTWTQTTSDPGLIAHLINMYFTYHYACFPTLSRKLFWRDFTRGKAGVGSGMVHCSSLLVNAILALGCHFTNVPGAYGTLGDSRTKGDHFFAEAKRLIVENDAYERPRLVTVQALALMSMREAGCAREAKGWVYSGMSFRMAQDIGLNLELNGLDKERMPDEQIDARRVTFWGCFTFDKCWSNYLGRLPQIQPNSFNVSKIDVFPDEDAAPWTRITDDGFDESSTQPSRTRAAALQMLKLCEISNDLLIFFYHPNHIGRSSGKTAELKKLSELHQRLEEWRKSLPTEFEAAREKQLPNVILMHMFFHLQYIHLFRPFLKYVPSASPLPAHISPRRICTANACAISKLMRIYKKYWSLRQICNIVVYMIHSACTIHLLNLPEKTARRDFTHGVKELEEIAEDWLCARRTLSILSVLARKWCCELPDEAAVALQRADDRYGHYSTSDVPSPDSNQDVSPLVADNKTSVFSPTTFVPVTHQAQPYMAPQTTQPQPMANHMQQDESLQMLGNTGMPSQQQQTQPQAQPQPHPQGTPTMAFIPDGMDTNNLGANGMGGGWSRTNLTSPTQPNHYGNSFVPLTAANIGANSGHGQLGIPQVPLPGTNSMPIDSQDWILTDSARWQQHFAGWETAMPGVSQNTAQAQAPHVSLQHQQQHQQQPQQQDETMFGFGEHGQTHARNTIVNMSSPEDSEHHHFTGMEGLGTQNWLPDLD